MALQGEAMSVIPGFVSSSVGKKAVMATTGVVLFGFVVAHMAGNMLLYQGPEALNAYGARLHAMPALLWVARLTLILATLLHVWAATALTVTNLRARPVGYRDRHDLAATYASRTMVWSGPILALFVGYHLAHFTLGSAHPDFVAGDVYHNVVRGFQVPLVAAFYVLAMLALGLHLYHGAWSMFQSLGVEHPRYDPLRKAFAVSFAVLLVAGNVSFPIAVLLGVVR
jgi:succinate dehydrogenase / fumarate reductase cytochrome b subunit